MLGEDWKEPINITKEQWTLFLEDRGIIKEKDIKLLELIYKCDCKATASQLAQLLNMSYHSALNLQVGRLGKRIEKTLNIQGPKHRYGPGRGQKSNYWNIPFWGEERKEGFYWILRPELKAAMEGMKV